ncbi:hypothetical protein [Streptomyces sp. 35G-GA-8]|uniref:hypothetical protein n=1 Tax=Streptomyces sp. 35G-GA-8 TaxID=2939434 RepID=UPI00201F8391|nr:hypothetical protein [Streptomyces sp. 35G-GA-8]MCL7380048.1 hypothetical protein [Streptomyces sp. 35G-GA-8]
MSAPPPPSTANFSRFQVLDGSPNPSVIPAQREARREYANRVHALVADARR